jgi:amicyanin
MVSIINMSFVASSIAINKGVTVTWTNNDAMPHTVTANDNSFTSATLNKGDTYSYTFNSAGTVAYHCKIHPGMMGAVVVN